MISHFYINNFSFLAFLTIPAEDNFHKFNLTNLRFKVTFYILFLNGYLSKEGLIAVMYEVLWGTRKKTQTDLLCNHYT